MLAEVARRDVGQVLVDLAPRSCPARSWAADRADRPALWAPPPARGDRSGARSPPSPDGRRDRARTRTRRTAAGRCAAPCRGVARRRRPAGRAPALSKLRPRSSLPISLLCARLPKNSCSAVGLKWRDLLSCSSRRARAPSAIRIQVVGMGTSTSVHCMSSSSDNEGAARIVPGRGRSARGGRRCFDGRLRRRRGDPQAGDRDGRPVRPAVMQPEGSGAR